MQPLKNEYPYQTSGAFHAVDRKQEQQKDNQLVALTKSEESKLDNAVMEYKHPQLYYSCNKNILDILKKMPEEINKKLKIIIATHEGNGLVTYYNTSYRHHVFILAKRDDGLYIYDPQLPEHSNIKSSNWIRSVYNNSVIEFTLTNRVTIKSLPQFRFLEASTYIEEYEESLDFKTLHPEYGLEQMSSSVNSLLWNKSIRINLFEICQLFTEERSYENTTKNLDGIQSPLDRLRAEEITFLREFYKST